MNIFSLAEGAAPLIVSVPHAGIYIPGGIERRMTPAARRLPDTDWHIPRLYDFAAGMGVTIISACYSRYVIDLNRPPDNAALYPGQTKVSLCPDETFEGEKIYNDGEEPGEAEIAERLETYWRPYHDALGRQIERVKQLHGYVILYDAHSIKGTLPRLFDGRLPDINLGTAGGSSCALSMEQAAFRAAQGDPYTSILNGRFIGGYITRNYGRPADHIHALQMELVRGNYMNEDDFSFAEERARNLRARLERVIQALLSWGVMNGTPPRTTP